MPRPRCCRFIERDPCVRMFKPCGVIMRDLPVVDLPVDGLEAMRLADLEGMTSEQGAELMGVSRHTFGRMLAQARRAAAEALVHGHALRIAQSANVRSKSHDISFPKEHKAMKIAVSSEGPGLESMVDPRFGRAAGFVLVDSETMDNTYLDNGASQVLAQGAGIETAQRVAEAGAEVVLSGYVGPKAFEALKAADIQICQNLDGRTVREAVDLFLSGKASAADAPNEEGRHKA